jgi:serine protease Do
MVKYTSTLLLVLTATLIPSVSYADTDLLANAAHAFNDLAEKTIPSVVSIQTIKTMTPAEMIADTTPGSPGWGLPRMPDQQHQDVVGLGSGFFIRPDGYILTNNHVVDHAIKIQVSFDRKTKYPAHLVGTDSKTDLAVIKLDSAADLPKKVTPLTFADSQRIKVGDWAIAVGSPYGLKQTVTFGIISAKGRAQMGILDIEDFIQTDAAINPGSSGGPLLDTKGQIIGVNTAIFSQGGGFSGIGFAVPAQIAKEVSDELIAKGHMSRGWVGLFAQDLDPDLVKHFHSPSTQGALISDVVKNGPANQASLQAGDIIIKYNNQPIDGAAQLKSFVGKTRSGAVIPLEVARNGGIRNVDISVAEQPGNGAPVKQLAGTVPTERDGTLGLVVEDLPKELTHYLKLDPKDGAIIVSVRPGGAGFDASLNPGDIILSINQKPVHGAKDFGEKMLQLKTADSAVLYIQHGPEDKTFVPIKLNPS